MFNRTWANVTAEALINFWEGFLNFIPSLIIATIIFVIGWFFAVLVGRIITEILKRLKIDKAFEKRSLKHILAKADLKVEVSGFIGAIAKWILIIVFLMIAVEILGLEAFAIFLGDILVYLPNVIVAAFIFVVAVIIIDIIDKITKAGVEGIKEGYGQMVSAIVRWAIWAFTFLAIFHQLGVAPEFMAALFYGIVAMLTISFGLAFGLGGKDVAAEILQDLRKNLKKEE